MNTVCTIHVNTTHTSIQFQVLYPKYILQFIIYPQKIKFLFHIIYRYSIHITYRYKFFTLYLSIYIQSTNKQIYIFLCISIIQERLNV